ncbi:MAG: hypothetical protein IIB44_13705 [Candidatus Marinimicrobia bacterium]|nr:hypothetical protein [Candidatus Neomarinimicrobiota bacterium]MCH8069385.1 hypothetical protein [Candidatus Neomarinimicrobiota bacterium]
MWNCLPTLTACGRQRTGKEKYKLPAYRTDRADRESCAQYPVGRNEFEVPRLATL